MHKEDIQAASNEAPQGIDGGQEGSESQVSENKPTEVTPPKETEVESPEKTIRIRNDSLKNGKILLGNGKVAEFSDDGIAEIEASQADRLLKIPGYEKA